MEHSGTAVARVSTGVNGLDEILHGGLKPGRAYLVRGGPGCGKTTLGLHFLSTGAARGEQSLYISLGEPEAQIRDDAQGLHIPLDNITFLDLSPSPEFFSEGSSYDIFSPAEVEREPMMQSIKEAIETLRPARVFVDSMTQFRYLSTDSFHFRKQALSFMRYLVEQDATVLVTSEGTQEIPDDDLQFMSDGIIHLDFSAEGRTITVSKFRGSSFRSGAHSMSLSEHGMAVFPRLVPSKQRIEQVLEPLSSGVPELDEMLHGGIDRGTSTIISGPTGVGKTTFGMQFIKEAAGRGDSSVVYTFEEGVNSLLRRCSAISIPARAMVERGTLLVEHVEPLRYSPDEFATMVREEVLSNSRRIVMIDSLSGYRLSMQGRDLISHVHALTVYLKSLGVTVILINEVEAITGEFRATDDKVSYLADSVIFMRYLELGGELRKAIGVLKKRSGDFEKTLRKLEITRYGLKVGRPLSELRGILSGSPEFVAPNE